MWWLQQSITVLIRAIAFIPGIIAMLMPNTIRRACRISYRAEVASQLAAATSLMLAVTVACIISYVFLPDQNNSDADILSSASYGVEPFLISSTIDLAHSSHGQARRWDERS
ncbi:hypothetical protein AC579_5518 [Pseudocercospora musae]|uniref:Uncharacterized protein n=1 Tax=Pseudocercospora musae TaxID=113226 RepID=A0A139IMC1_9PEZI|nr:hypothetical protein AC579_5518 [Pseudocercospora musae]